MTFWHISNDILMSDVSVVSEKYYFYYVKKFGIDFSVFQVLLPFIQIFFHLFVVFWSAVYFQELSFLWSKMSHVAALHSSLMRSFVESAIFDSSTKQLISINVFNISAKFWAWKKILCYQILDAC